MSLSTATLPLPAEAPIMFLPGTVLLPEVMLPLFIFEPRYRAMLAHSLEQERMFCIALLKPGVEEARTRKDFFTTAGLGLVRACVGRDDGTSHLVLQGLARVKIGEFRQQRPFRIAELEVLPSEAAPDAASRRVAEEIRTRCQALIPEDVEEPNKVREQFAQLEDLGTLCDVVTHTFVRDPLAQQSVLEEASIHTRLRMVRDFLRANTP